MIYKIADFYIDIKCVYAATEKTLAPYASEDGHAADFAVFAKDAEIDAMAAEFAEYHGDTEYARSYMERLVLLQKLNSELVLRGAFLMHGALIEYEGVGYIFTAQSGTGKTTHVELWKKRFGDAVHIVNGDKPFLRVMDGEVYAYGTPWCGKEGYNINTRVKLSKICFIERAAKNSISDIPESAALSRLLSQVEVVTSRDLGAQLSMLDVLFSSCDMYLLRCNMEPCAAEVAYNGMK